MENLDLYETKRISTNNQTFVGYIVEKTNITGKNVYMKNKDIDQIQKRLDTKKKSLPKNKQSKFK